MIKISTLSRKTKIFRSYSTSELERIIAAFIYGLGAGAKLINTSITFDSEDGAIIAAVTYESWW